MTRLLSAALVVFLGISAAAPVSFATPIRRTVIALYDSTYDEDTLFSPSHQLAAMPLNHLGLALRYQDINDGLPSLQEMDEVRGVITWFRSDLMADPVAFLKWAGNVIDSGRKFVVIGDLSVSRDRKGRPTPIAAIDEFWSKLGMRNEQDWTAITYDWNVSYRNPAMVDFERKFAGVLPSFNRMTTVDPRAQSQMVIRLSNDPATDSAVVVTHPNGGYVAEGFTHYFTLSPPRRQWYLNPFEFFRTAFATDDLPKPDTTTISGRRIFYSHVDGDGWRNQTEILPYRKQRSLAAEVILKEVLKAYGDLPITVAPIAADLDPEWNGTEESVRIAREMFALPNVEGASHTYAHPLDWGALERLHSAGANRPAPSWMQSIRSYFAQFFGRGPEFAAEYGGFDERYDQPISYATKPFDLDREIRGSIEFINGLLPEGKRVRLIQWSGNTRPFEAAIEAARAAGVNNLNGGDSRYDSEFYSYGWVSPLGRQVGKQHQIFSSNSNENTYTRLWTDSFFGFRYLVRTLQHTDTPFRIKPHNIYFHIYSGEKIASLAAVHDNFKYARQQEIAPITASNYAAIGDGFFSTEIEALGDRQWRISNRGALQTIRFDHATLMQVDFAASPGVIGQRHYQGSLYVALDASHAAPIITLKDYSTPAMDPPALLPYLIDSRWLVSNVRVRPDGFEFETSGFGAGEFTWRIPGAGAHIIHVTDSSGAEWVQRRSADDTGRMTLNLGPAGSGTVHVAVTPLAEKTGR